NMNILRKANKQVKKFFLDGVNKGTKNSLQYLKEKPGSPEWIMGNNLDDYKLMLMKRPVSNDCKYRIYNEEPDNHILYNTKLVSEYSHAEKRPKHMPILNIDQTADAKKYMRESD